MTSKQRIHLMGLWRDARRIKGWPSSDSELRHQFYERVLGVPRRFSEFSESDFDRVKAELLLILRPSGLNDQLRQLRQVKHRAIWKVRMVLLKLLAVYVGQPDKYLARILAEKFGGKSLDELGAESGQDEGSSEVRQLIMTLNRAIHRRRSMAGHTIRQMHELAGLALPAPKTKSDNEPF